MLLGERRSRTWESQGGVQLGPGEAVCGQAGHEVTEGSPCPPPPALSRPTCGRLSNSAAFPPVGALGQSRGCRQAGARPVLCVHILVSPERCSLWSPEGASMGVSWSKQRESKPSPLPPAVLWEAALAAPRRNCELRSRCPPSTSQSKGLNISLKTLQCLGNQLNGLSVQLLRSRVHSLAF